MWRFGFAIVALVISFAAIASGDDKPKVEPKPGKSPAPQTVVVPGVRDFKHPHEVVTVSSEGVTIVRMADHADENRMFFMFELHLKDSGAKDKKPSVNEFGIFTLKGKYDGWKRLNAKEILFRIDGRELKCECTREDDLIKATFPLAELPSLLAAKDAHVRIAEIEFDFVERHLEGMRDVASRIPDGKSSHGFLNIEHRPDGIKPSAGIANGERANRIIKEMKSKRVAELKKKIQEIDEAKSRLKSVVISDDRQAITDNRKRISSLQAELQSLRDSPLSPDGIDFRQLSTGQVGRLTGLIKVVQILNKAKGEVIVYDDLSRPLVFAKLIGIDASNLVDDSRVADNHVFVVDGTYSYETVSGGTSTIFKLQAVSPDLELSERESKSLRDASNANFEIDLTAEERAKSKLAQDANAASDREKQKMADAAQEKKDSDAKTRRAQSYLEAGKSLLNKDNRSAAKKQFEKAVAESPDSAAGKEAATQLKKLQ